jgi:hypothetical protein
VLKEGERCSPNQTTVTYWMIETDDSSPPSDGGEGTSRPPPDSTSSRSTAKKLSVHDPPRWRFINRAKKTEGYSSMAAGYIVKGAFNMHRASVLGGHARSPLIISRLIFFVPYTHAPNVCVGLSAQELVGKYIPPAARNSPMRAKSKDTVVVGSSRRELMHEREKVGRNVGTTSKFHDNEGDDGIRTTFDCAVNGTPEEKDHPPHVSDEQEDEPSAVVVEVAPSLGVLEKSDEPVLQPMMPLPSPVSLIVQNEKQTPRTTDNPEDEGGDMIGTFDYAVNGTPEEKDHPPNVSNEQEDEPSVKVAGVLTCLQVLVASSEQDALMLQNEKQTPSQTDDAKVADLEAMSTTSDDGQLGWVEKQIVAVAEELMQTAEGPVEPVDAGSLVSITASEFATKKLHNSPVSELEDAFMGFTLQSDRNCSTPSIPHEVHRNLPLLTPSPTNSLPLQLYHYTPTESSEPSQQISANVKPTTPINDKIHVTPCKNSEEKGSIIPQPPVESGSTACKHRHGTGNDLPLGIMAGILTTTSAPKFALNRTTPSKGSEPKHPPTSSKRKPKQKLLLSSPLKRQKLEKLLKTKSTVWGAGVQLYNGRSVDRISTIKKCTNKFCIWEPRIHAQRAACERCWALASVAERSEFIANGRHLRIQLVRGGCPRSCSLFAPEERKNKSGTSHEEAMRLCRRCFSDMHYVGIR